MKFIVLGLLFASSAHALEVGFDRENEISEVEIYGRVSMYCSTTSSSFNCYRSGLVGGNRSCLFIKNGTIDADFVKLQRVGSRYIKGSRFDSKKGRSKSSFNLWLRSLTQRALLTRGVNTIKFQFFKKNQLIEEGEFEVTVETSESRDCGLGTINIRTGQCPQQYQACDQLFRYRNYCR